MTMTTPYSIAIAYLETWNQTAPERRRTLLNQHWTDDASYIDPLMAREGKEQIAGLIDAVHSRFTGFKFVLRGTPDGHGEHVRLSWSLGPEGAEAPIEGTDFVRISDGKIRHVVGFIDRAPPM
jgi:hypothetical protein